MTFSLSKTLIFALMTAYKVKAKQDDFYFASNSVESGRMKIALQVSHFML